MALTFGFYNSQNGDRKYNATQVSRIFEGIINDGVFASIGDALQVTAGSGMSVNVGIGRAWFNNTWTDNDSVLPLTLDPSEVILNRIDAVVLEVASSSDVRTNSIKIVKGTPNSVPVAPTMIKTVGQYQYPLAYIYVGAGVTSITSGNITSKINTVDCPTVKVVGVDGLMPLWENEFNTWFAALQAQMAGNVATNLQNQITANLNTEKANKTKYATCSTAAATAAKVATQADFSLVVGQITAVKFTNANTAANMTLNINGTGAKAVYCCGSAVGADKIIANQLALFQYDGTYFQLLNPADYASNVLLSTAAQSLFGISSVDLALQKLKNYNVVTITSTQNWTVPANVKECDLFMCAGGGGAGFGGYTSGGTGGGGGECKFIPNLKLTPGAVIGCTIGAGGNGAVYNGASATDGGDTLFGSYLTKGGKCGLSGSMSGGYAQSGGAGYSGGGACSQSAGGPGGNGGEDGMNGQTVSAAGGIGIKNTLHMNSYARNPFNGLLYGSGGGCGGSGNYQSPGGVAGLGGSGAGNGGTGAVIAAAGINGGSGLANRGGGGGGGGGIYSGTNSIGGSGGSGVIMIGYYA